jgi:hypothetical protein
MNVDNRLVKLVLWPAAKPRSGPEKGARPLRPNLDGINKRFLQIAAYWTSRHFLGSIGSCSRKHAGFLRR